MYIRIYIHTVSSLDLEKVALLCVFDQAHVETSARRQVSADVIKPSAGQYTICTNIAQEDRILQYRMHKEYLQYIRIHTTCIHS